MDNQNKKKKKNDLGLSNEELIKGIKSGEFTFPKNKDMVKCLIKTFICSDYYIRYEKEQDVSKVDTLDDVSEEWHLVADLKKDGLTIVATYNARTEMLTIRKCGLWFLIPSEQDPIRKFVENVEKSYMDNMNIAREVVKKKTLKSEIKSS